VSACVLVWCYPRVEEAWFVGANNYERRTVKREVGDQKIEAVGFLSSETLEKRQVRTPFSHIIPIK